MHRSLLLLRLQNLKSCNVNPASLSTHQHAQAAQVTTTPGQEDHAMASGATLDPYEQQLLAVFESCCDGSQGVLDPRGLTSLCEKLQLEEQTPHLLERLLGSPRSNSPRKITFAQFRDALLALLAGVSSSDDFDGSPEREVRPKFVYGTKKYGRRSKPEDDDLTGSESEPPSPTRRKESPSKIMSASELAKKRKTSQEKTQKSEKEAKSWEGELSEEEECVRATWEKLGAAHNGYLGQEELTLVCKATGLEGVANELVQQLFTRLGVEPTGKISFEQFLHLFRSGLGTAATEEDDLTMAEHHRSLSFHADSSSKEPLYISLETFNNGMVSSDQLLEMLESGGVMGAARLLHDLGLGASARRPVSLQELAYALEEEAKALTEEQHEESSNQRQATPENPLLSVLQASVFIYQAEAKCLKNSLEQAVCERNKLKLDLAEANERAALMAQEVDDRHMRLEDSYKKQIRTLEQKHQDEVKGLQAELSSDREQMAVLTTGLELRMDQMQSEESKLRAEVTTWLKKSELLEKENNQLKEFLAASDEVKLQLQKKVDTIPDLQIRLSDLEREQAEVRSQQVQPLMDKVELLTTENTALRDANDELTLKLEQTTISNKSLMETEDLEVVSPRGSSKRKGRTADICSDDSSEDEIRPQGKQRRKALVEDTDETKQLRERVAELERKLAECQDRLQAQGSENEPLRRAGAPHSSSPPRHPLKQVFQVVRAQILDEILGDPEQVDDHPLLQEISRLQTRCKDLTQLQKTMEAEFEMQLHDAREESEMEINSPRNPAKQSSMPPSPRNPSQSESLMDSMEGSSKNVEQLEQECNHLKENLDQVKVEIVRILSDKEACSKENSVLKEQISDLTSKVEASTQHPSDSFKVEEIGVDEKVKKLEDRVKELESCLELMQEEYEKCEDYWQGKLDDERRLFEQEQEVESKKFTELEEKIQELLSQEQEEANMKARLSPIDEKVLMEQQVNDLEEECAELRKRLHALESESEIYHIMLNIEKIDAAVQTDVKPKLAALFLNSGTIISSSSDKQIQANLSSEELNHVRNPYDLISPTEWNRRQNGYSKQSATSTFKSGLSNLNRAPEQSCRVQLSVMQTLSERLQQQEVKGRRLEAALSINQLNTQRLIQQHQEEIVSLQAAIQAGQLRLQQQIIAYDEQSEKLASADMLVKELYVENAYLTSSVEQLEKKCIFLTQHAPGSA
ncbi:ninein-like protein isoform X1 [Cloeon dipterum]|uniref:ninein-like protein isoform X1 n=2 Tax=Cloeon dipterum TaxID=197152 RepID=UPI0032209B14